MFPIICRQCGQRGRVASVPTDLACRVCRSGVHLDLDTRTAANPQNDPRLPMMDLPEGVPVPNQPMAWVDPLAPVSEDLPEGSAPYSQQALGAHRTAAWPQTTEWYVAHEAPETPRGFVDVAGPFDSQAEAQAAQPQGDGYSVWAKNSDVDQQGYERFMTGSRRAAAGDQCKFSGRPVSAQAKKRAIYFGGSWRGACPDGHGTTFHSTDKWTGKTYVNVWDEHSVTVTGSRKTAQNLMWWQNGPEDRPQWWDDSSYARVQGGDFFNYDTGKWGSFDDGEHDADNLESYNQSEIAAGRDPRTAKRAQIVTSVLASNPGMTRKTAERVARQTMARYPVVAGTDLRRFEDIGYAAYGSDAPRAPSANAEVREALEGRAVGESDTKAIMQAYTTGYDRAADEAARAALREGSKTASWLPTDASDDPEYYSYETEGIGEATVSMEIEGNPAEHTGRWEWDAFTYDDLPKRGGGVEPSLSAAQQCAEDWVNSGQMSLFGSRRASKRASTASKTAAMTKAQVRKRLLAYAWNGTPAEQAAEVECILAQDGWKYIDAVADQFNGAQSGESTDLSGNDFALSALYEAHDGPHLPSCPAAH